MAKSTDGQLIRDWGPVRILINAADGYAQSRSGNIERLLQESESILSPLQDPMKVDLGLHRWLAAAREESYSDWRAWILQEVLDSSLLLDFFGINDPELAATLKDCTHRILREQPITVDGRHYRLDIVVQFSTNERDHESSLIVEIKTGSAENADTEKQKFYELWHREQPVLRKIVPSAILIVTDAKNTEYSGFQVLLWDEACIRLRRMLPAITRTQSIVKASMVIAFISAVERNLLRLELSITEGGGFAGALLVEHLERAVQPGKGQPMEIDGAAEEDLLRKGAEFYWLATSSIKEYEALIFRKCRQVVAAERGRIAATVGSPLERFNNFTEILPGAKRYAALGISANGSNGSKHYFALWWQEDKLYAAVWTTFKANGKKDSAWQSLGRVVPNKESIGSNTDQIWVRHEITTSGDPWTYLSSSIHEWAEIWARVPGGLKQYL